jgi:glucosylceramidase
MSTSPLWITTSPGREWIEKKPRPANGQPNLEVTDETLQTVDGFGGCFNERGADVLWSLPEDRQEQVMHSLFDPEEGCRFGLCRLPIGASDYALQWYSHNENEDDWEMDRFSIDRDRRFLIPYIRQAMAIQPELTLFASPWSPPTWMKRPRAYNYGRIPHDERILNAYALYFLRFVQAYETEGLRIDQIHPQNEPVADQKFPSCVWSGELMRDFIRDYLGPLFDAEYPESEIWLGTINSEDYDAWANTVLSDDAARSFISGVGYQWAGKHAIQRTAVSWPEMRLLQTENECGDGENSWDYAHYVFDLIWHYFTNGAHGYVYWNMILAPGGESTWGWNQNSMITIDPSTRTVCWNPEYYVMKHFARFIPQGSVRLRLRGPWTAKSLAFSNPQGQLVVVIANPFEHERTLTLLAGDETVECELVARSINTCVFAG